MAFILELQAVEKAKEAKYPLILETVGEAPSQYGEVDEEES